MDAARTLMNEHGIRHLPVTDPQGRLFGLLSERDLLLAEALTPIEDPTVGVICTTPPYIVDIGTRLDYVVDEMARWQRGSALIVKQNKLVGILTTTDVCRILALLLRRLSPGLVPTADDVA